MSEFALSASRILTYLKCSLVYYAENVVRFVDEGNDGARRGSVCHDIFEILVKPKNKKRVDKILKHGDISVDKALCRLIEFKILEYGIGEEDPKGNGNRKMIHDMIYVGLNTDFFCKGWKIDYDNLETKFTLKNKSPEYVLRGLIDKPAKRYKKYKIADYKSSSQPKSESELNGDIQAWSYILFAKKELKMDAFVEFIFLRYPENPIRIVQTPTEDALRGFEDFLGEMYAHLKDFTYDKALDNLAYDKGYVKDGGFEGRVCCGRTTEPNMVKKDGTPQWECKYKWPSTYYSIVDKNGKILQSSKDILDLNPQEGQEIKEFDWKGCPRFN